MRYERTAPPLPALMKQVIEATPTVLGNPEAQMRLSKLLASQIASALNAS